jgi:hypothetical protein
LKINEKIVAHSGIISPVMRARRSFLLLAALGLTTTCFTLTACSRANQPVVIVYDQKWASEAGIANLGCAHGEDICQKEAIESEANFLNQLSTAFKEAPERKDIEFIVDSGTDQSSKGTDARLKTVKKGPFWRLRVDYRPRLTLYQESVLGAGYQEAKLGFGTSRACSGISGPSENIVKGTCELAKKNCVLSAW